MRVGSKVEITNPERIAFEMQGDVTYISTMMSNMPLWIIQHDTKGADIVAGGFSVCKATEFKTIKPPKGLK